MDDKQPLAKSSIEARTPNPGHLAEDGEYEPLPSLLMMKVGIEIIRESDTNNYIFMEHDIQNRLFKMFIDMGYDWQDIIVRDADGGEIGHNRY